MSENVVQHGAFGQPICEGLAGYHVEPSRFAFSIGVWDAAFFEAFRNLIPGSILKRGAMHLML